jgi:TP53 regulating kinase and related kinases
MIPESIKIIENIGKGKSGISYLAQYDNREVVLKEMHDETVFYYDFKKSKIELELDAYDVLKNINIRIPAIVLVDKENNYILKEYVAGKTITEIIVGGKLDDDVFKTILDWEQLLKRNNINIDYYPSNFVYNGKDVFYIDYEMNPYSEDWNFRNWGIYYWVNGNGFKKYIETKDSTYINIEGTGIPVKTDEIVAARSRILEQYEK